ncbi:hypothetical protein EC973_006507 [Apophysomyces ossiformis]|uniref:NAD(P)-binding domain-containing protein n=1 Tax=Apophysomyces ossiformis TaxID=679940 RepID=A0A8H7EUJ9_9FUNG|nr:hypothetical protein EC973_006507 [Apophysomyces ossiformis]
MAAPVSRKVLVVGGTGFLGMSVCKLAAAKGWETVSLSRRGEPEGFLQRRPSWADKVQWISGDSLDATTYADRLEGVTNVVHTVGILLEADYKRIVQAQSVCEAAKGVPQVLAELVGMKDYGNPLDPHRPERTTYEKMNRDTAVAVANAVAKTGSMQSFVYISASDVLPFVNARYITTKREAEQYLFRQSFRSTVLRPGFMYSQDRPAGLPLATGLQLLNALTRPVAKELATLPLGKSVTTPPLHVDTVASAAIAAIENDTKGIFDVQGIQSLNDWIVNYYFMKLLFSVVSSSSSSIRPEKRLFKVIRKRIQAAQRRTIVSSSHPPSAAAAAAATALTLGHAATGAGGGASGGGLLFPRTAIVGYARVPFGSVRPLPPSPPLATINSPSPCNVHKNDDSSSSSNNSSMNNNSRYMRLFRRDSQTRGMGDLIQQHHGNPSDKRPGLVRRTTVGHAKDPYHHSPQIYLSIMLKPNATTELVDCPSARVDETLIESVHVLGEQIRLHFAYILTLLRRLMVHNQRFDVALDGGELRIIFPPHLFAPYPPTKERVRRWLNHIGIDPESPHFTIDEVMRPPSDTMDEVFGPEYFRGIHLFLDHVDDLIEMGPAFYHRRHSR